MRKQIETDDSQRRKGRVQNPSDNARKTESDGPSSSSNSGTCVYNMNNPKRGKAIIFNHYKFKYDRETIRKGTNKDCKDLKQLLEKLHFEVQVYEDLPKKEFITVLETARDEDHSQNDCIFIAIMSHGEGKCIATFDEDLQLDTIMKIIDDSESLEGKPKIFIIQACRGKGVQPDGPAGAWEGPEFDHFVVGYSTVPGYISYREAETGSLFIQALVEVFAECHETTDFLRLLTRVKAKVKEKTIKICSPIQICSTFTNLDRDLYLKKKCVTPKPHPPKAETLPKLEKPFNNRSVEEGDLKCVLAIKQNNTVVVNNYDQTLMRFTFECLNTNSQWIKCEPRELLYEKNVAPCQNYFASAIIGDLLYIVAVHPRRSERNHKGVTTYNFKTKAQATLQPLKRLRVGVFCVVLRGSFYVVGGGESGINTKAIIERWDPVNNEWCEETEMLEARYGIGAVVFRDCLYVVGGADTKDSKPQAAVECYNPETRTWLKRASMNKPRIYHGVAAGNDYLYAMGGKETWRKTVERYDPIEDKWTLICLLNNEYEHISCVINGERLFAMGTFKPELKWITCVEELDLTRPEKWTVSREEESTGGPINLLEIPSTLKEFLVSPETKN